MTPEDLRKRATDYVARTNDNSFSVKQLTNLQKELQIKGDRSLFFLSSFLSFYLFFFFLCLLVISISQPVTALTWLRPCLGTGIGCPSSNSWPWKGDIFENTLRDLQPQGQHKAGPPHLSLSWITATTLLISWIAALLQRSRSSTNASRRLSTNPKRTALHARFRILQISLVPSSSYLRWWLHFVDGCFSLQ